MGRALLTAALVSLFPVPASFFAQTLMPSQEDNTRAWRDCQLAESEVPRTPLLHLIRSIGGSSAGRKRPVHDLPARARVAETSGNSGQTRALRLAITGQPLPPAAGSAPEHTEARAVRMVQRHWHRGFGQRASQLELVVIGKQGAG